jgi:hypothetical protein
MSLVLLCIRILHLVHTSQILLYYKHALRRLPVAVPRMYLLYVPVRAAISSLYYYIIITVPIVHAPAAAEYC